MQKNLLILVLLGMFSCQKQEAKPMLYEVEASLQPYVKSFVEEAEKRGISIKVENLVMKFGITPANICGQYEKDAAGQRSITLNQAGSCWQNAPKENREALAFHELAHCFLNRQHRDDVFPSSAVVSIMHIQNSGPYGPCIYPIDGDNTCNKTDRRSYYIDELFNDKTPAPAWAK